jgi:hypothetical protein
MSVCCMLLCVMHKNWNVTAVGGPIELKLGGDVGLVSQISVHVLVSRFYQTNKQNKRRNRKKNVLENLSCDIQMSTRNSVVCLFCLF